MGGLQYFKQTYKSPNIVRPKNCDSDGFGPDSDGFRSDSERSALTCIYFLLDKTDQFSSFHRLKSNELWLLHEGGPLFIHLINPETKEIDRIILANPLEFPGSTFQAAIPIKTWFAAELDPKAE